MDLNKKLDLIKISEFARKIHNDANKTYDGQEYYVHIEMVEYLLDRFSNIFKHRNDYYRTRAASSLHDTMEDCGLSFNEIVKISDIQTARIVLAVTDVHEENRLLRHLLTMHKTVKEYGSIILKMGDMHSNGKYSKTKQNSKYNMYVEEYNYRRPIFKKALLWYPEHLNMDVVDNLWTELDEIHGFTKNSIGYGTYKWVT